MLPPQSDERWKNLVLGQIEHDFKSLPAGLMLSLIKRQIKNDSSDISVSICIKKIFSFFQLHEAIMREDINNIFYSGRTEVDNAAQTVYDSSKNTLATISEVMQMIQSGKQLFLAGDENALSILPKGNWIGGTIPYFMSENGGVSVKDKIFVTQVPDYIQDREIKLYSANEIDIILKDRPAHGFSFIIIPAKSEVHIAYAQKAPNRSNLFMKPIIGWISGTHLDDINKKNPKVFNGLTGENTEKKAVVMHTTLPPDKMATIGIINIFRQGSGDSIKFTHSGFSVKDCLINGVQTNFAEYLMSNKVDIRLPLVSNYNGTMVNVSFQEIIEQEKTVNFYAPVFKNIEYKLASPINDYITEFTKHLLDEQKSPVFACNCILNYLYSELEGKKTGAITGPVTFGEIAYQLLNQTLTYLNINEIS